MSEIIVIKASREDGNEEQQTESSSNKNIAKERWHEKVMNGEYPRHTNNVVGKNRGNG